MSVLSFQKLSGELSTDGKILEQLIKLNETSKPDVYTFFNALYPNKLPKLIEMNFNSMGTDFGQHWIPSDPNYDFQGKYFGIWDITAFAGGNNEDRDDVYFRNGKDEIVCLIGDQGYKHFIGEITNAVRKSGYINFNAHFIGFKVETSFLYQTSGLLFNEFSFNYNEQSYGVIENPNEKAEVLLSEGEYVTGISSKFFYYQKNNNTPIASDLSDGNWRVDFPVNDGDLVKFYDSPFPKVIFEKHSNVSFEILVRYKNGDWSPLAQSQEFIIDGTVDFDVKALSSFIIVDENNDPTYFVGQYETGWQRDFVYVPNLPYPKLIFKAL